MLSQSERSATHETSVARGIATSEPPSVTEPRRPPARVGTPKPVRHRRWRRAALVATVVALLGFGVVTTSFLRKKGGDEGVDTTRTIMGEIARTLDDYRAHNGRLPAELSRLFDPRYRYEGDVVPEDAWREMIEYRVIDAQKGTYRLRSRGPDRRAGTPDDLVWPIGTAWDGA